MSFESDSDIRRASIREERRTLLAASLAPIGAGVVALWLAWRHAEGSLAAASVLLLGCGFALLASRRRVADSESGRGGLRALRAPLVLLLLGPFVVLAPLAAGRLLELAAKLPWLGERLASPPSLPGWGGEPSSTATLVALVALLVCSFSGALFARYLSGGLPDELRWLAPLARWLRVSAWASLLAAFPLATALAGRPLGGRAIAVVLWALVALLTLELAFRVAAAAFARFSSAERPTEGLRLLAEPGLLRLLASRADPLRSIFDVLSELFGIDLRSAWAIRFARRALLPIGVGLLMLAWLLTSVTMVGIEEQALVERFGRLARDAPLDSGLHLKWPWPIERVIRAPVHRVQSFLIGYEGQRAGASMLWTVQHSAEEHTLLLGDGRDLVSVNAILNYRIADIERFVYAHQDPVEALRRVADRILLTRIVRRALDEVLSENLALLAEELEAAVQDAADAKGLGIEIVDLTIVGLHPPIAVARDYQAVVGAQVEKEALILGGRAYREETIPRAQADAIKALNDARAHGATRLGAARGESAAFLSTLEGYRRSPRLFKLRSWLEAHERALSTRHVHVLDDRIERDGGALWVLE